MARKKVSKLIQAIQLFNELDGTEQQHLNDFIRSQRPPRGASKKTARVAVNSNEVKELRDRTGATIANCKVVLIEANNEVDTAEGLLRARGLAVKGADNEVEQVR